MFLSWFLEDSLAAGNSSAKDNLSPAFLSIYEDYSELVSEFGSGSYSRSGSGLILGNGSRFLPFRISFSHICAVLSECFVD